MTGQPQTSTSTRRRRDAGRTCLPVGQVLTRLSGALTVLAAAIALATPAAGQSQTENRLWMAFVAQGHFGDDSPWTWSADSLLRTRDFASTLEAVGQRVIVGRDLGSRSSVGAGYLLGQVYPSQGDGLIDQRFLQQFAWAQESAEPRIVCHGCSLVLAETVS